MQQRFANWEVFKFFSNNCEKYWSLVQNKKQNMHKNRIKRRIKRKRHKSNG